ncbi:MAG: hypothetical protein ACT4PN_08780 [Nitrospiraceae bacterium]
MMAGDEDSTTDDDPVTAVVRKEKELTQHDLERARDGNDLGERFGRQNISSTAVSKVALESKKKEDEKFEHAMRQLLQQMREELERRLEELDKRIAETNAQIEELREELATTEELLSKQFGKDWQEKLKRGDLDPDDPLLRQWLMQQQQLKDYLERREKLIKERDELEEQVTEIEASDLPDHLKIEKIKEVFEQSTAPGVQEVWRDTNASQQVQDIAGSVNTGDGETIEVQEAATMFGQIAALSFAEKAGIGSGTDSKLKSITSTFAKAGEATTIKEPELVTGDIPSHKGPKAPS